MSRYRIVVRDKDGTELGEFTSWTNLAFSEKLNNYGTATFDVPRSSPELAVLTSLRRYEILIKRDNVTVWSGEQAHRTGSLGANSPDYVTITAYTFLEMLNARYSAAFVRYDQVDQGQILKSLVDYTQGLFDGDLGFTFGTVEETVLRDREYTHQNIMEAFINMSGVINGPDFFITHDKQINIVSQKGIDKSKQVIFEWPTNIAAATVTEDFVNPANQAIVLGAGFGSSQVYGVYTDTSARALKKLRQQRVSEVDVSTQDVLDAKAQAVVRQRKAPVLTVGMRQLQHTLPIFGTIATGDYVRLRIKQDIYSINSVVRTYSYEVRVNKDNNETIEYLLGFV